MAMNVEGIILKNFNYGEHHKILKVLTKEFGIIGIFVQNANKVNTKKSALVQPLTCAHFNLKTSTNAQSDLYYLYSGDSVNHFLNIKLDYEKISYFYVMVEIILKGCHESEHLSYVYKLLKTFLELGDEGYDAYLLSLIFQLKLLPILGVAPVFDYCVVCHKTDHIVTASVHQGGLICAHCYHASEPINLDASLIPILRALYKINIDDMPEIDLDSEYLKPIELFLDAYYDAYVGFKLSTKNFLKVL